MSSIRDLRDTLEQHAQTVYDVDLAGRPSAVHHRVRTVRRRRRATAVVGAAAAVAAVVAGVTLPEPAKEPVPAERLLVGETAPETLTSLGFTYDFAEGLEAVGRVSVDLADYDEPVLVTWATAGDDDRVRVEAYTGEDRVHRSPDFTGFVPMLPEEGDEVVVTGEGPLAVAVYTLGAPAPGVTTDGVTLREQVEDSRLVEGEVGQAGDTELVVETVVPESGRLALASSCRAVPEGYVVVEEIAGEPRSFGGCEDRSSLFDAASGDWTPLPLRDYGLEAGDPVTVRYYVAEDPSPKFVPQGVADGPAFDAVRLAAGLYETEPEVAVDGATFERVVEEDGRQWVFVSAQVGDRGFAQLEVEVPVGGESPTLVVAHASGLGMGTVHHFRDGQPILDSTNGIGPGGGFANQWVEYRPGHVYSMDAGGALRPDTRLSYGFYQQLD